MRGGRDTEGRRDGGRSCNNPSALLSRGEEGVMRGRSFDPEGGEGRREVGHLQEGERERGGEGEKREDGQYFTVPAM